MGSEKRQSRAARMRLGLGLACRGSGSPIPPPGSQFLLLPFDL